MPGFGHQAHAGGRGGHAGRARRRTGGQWASGRAAHTERGCSRKRPQGGAGPGGSRRLADPDTVSARRRRHRPSCDSTQRPCGLVRTRRGRTRRTPSGRAASARARIANNRAVGRLDRSPIAPVRRLARPACRAPGVAPWWPESRHDAAAPSPGVLRHGRPGMGGTSGTGWSSSRSGGPGGPGVRDAVRGAPGGPGAGRGVAARGPYRGGPGGGLGGRPGGGPGGGLVASWWRSLPGGPADARVARWSGSCAVLRRVRSAGRASRPWPQEQEAASPGVRQHVGSDDRGVQVPRGQRRGSCACLAAPPCRTSQSGSTQSRPRW